MSKEEPSTSKKGSGLRLPKFKSKSKAPKFTKHLQSDLVCKVGTFVHLEATVNEGKDAVKFKWSGPSPFEGAEDRIKISVEDKRTSCCNIETLLPEDEGVWTCTAKNKHGTSQSECQMIVQIPKSYKPPTFLEDLQAILSDQGTVSLECKVVGVPSPVLQWFKDDQEINTGDTFALKADRNKPTTRYRCVASNCMGTVSSEAEVNFSKSTL